MNVLKAIENALGFRRYLVIAFVSAAAFLYGVIRTAVAPYLPLPELAGWQIFAAVVPTFVLWFVARHAAELERALQPRLAIQGVRVERAKAMHESQFQLSQIKVKSTSYSSYVHVVVASNSESQVDDCSVTLTKAKNIGTGEFFERPVRLVGSGHHEHFVTLFPKVPQHFDLLHARTWRQKPEMGLAPELGAPLALADFFSAPGEYLLTVSASGTDTSTVSADVRVTWTGDWEQLKAELVKS